MEFGPDNKVDIDTLTRAEARAFIKFLKSEMKRHWEDIVDAGALIITVKEKHNV